MEQLPGFDDRQRCERIASRWNRLLCLGRYRPSSGHNDKCYYVALPFPVVLKVLAMLEEELDDIDYV